MIHIGRFLAAILLVVNGWVALLFLLVAYSPYFDPHSHPVWSSIGLLFPVFLLVNLFFLLFWLLAYPRYVLFPLLVFLLAWGPVRTYFPINIGGSSAPENAIKVLSFNTRAFGEKKVHTKEKPNQVLEYLCQSDADIICLQEYIWGGKLSRKDIDYALRKYRYKHYLPLAKGMNGLACYSRYPIIAAAPIRFDHTRNGSVAYSIKIANDTLLVVNNHLQSNRIMVSDVETYHSMIDKPESKTLLVGTKKLLGKVAEATAIRAKQVESVLDRVKAFKGKGIVVCGDFNDTPISYTYRIMSEDLQDAFVEAGCGLGISYNLHRMPFRIDHILLSKNMKVYDCEVDNSTKASDHYPIWCTFSWE